MIILFATMITSSIMNSYTNIMGLIYVEQVDSIYLG